MAFENTGLSALSSVLSRALFAEIRDSFSPDISGETDPISSTGESARLHGHCVLLTFCNALNPRHSRQNTRVYGGPVPTKKRPLLRNWPLFVYGTIKLNPPWRFFSDSSYPFISDRFHREVSFSNPVRWHSGKGYLRSGGGRKPLPAVQWAQSVFRSPMNS